MRGALIMVILGIAAGRFVEVSFSNTYIVCTLLALLFLSAILRRWDRVAPVFLVGALFVLGVFLIRNSEASPKRSFYGFDRVQAIAKAQKEKLKSIYAGNGLSGDTYDIVAAMTLGEKSGISKETRRVFSRSGGAHVLALSGMHLSILFMVLALILPTKRLPKISMTVEVIAVWAFVLLVGFFPSVVRAAVMLTIYCVARMLSRNTKSVDVLAFTAFLLLVISPRWLFDVGFQMSFAAMTGILLLYGPTYRFLTYRKPDNMPPTLWKEGGRILYDIIVGVVVISLAAQLGVAPLVAYYFGNFPVYFILTNLIVSPAAYFIMVLAIGMLIGLPLQAPLSAIVQGMKSLLEWIVQLPYSSLEVNISVWQTILIYIIIIALCRLVALFVRKTDRYSVAMP